MGLDFIRGKRARDRRLRDAAFQSTVVRHDLFARVNPLFKDGVKGRMLVPTLAVGDRLHGSLDASEAGGFLARGLERVIALPNDVASQMRNGASSTVAFVGEVVAINEKTKIAEVRVRRVSEDGDAEQ
jgi:hypothetical protein